MLAELRLFGPDAVDMRSSGPACLGRVLSRVLPEDDYDNQPYTLGTEGSVFVAEGRIDNRGEVASAIGIDAEALRTTSDSALLCRAWEHWQFSTFDHVIGDIALACWDADERSLTLARSPLSARSLFYCRSERFVAFASMPLGLLAIPQIPRAPDLHYCALAFKRGEGATSDETIFKNILAVLAGSAVQFKSNTVQVRRLWQLRSVQVPRNLPDFADALRGELDRAVRAQLRRRSGIVACQLSAGRDSSAVATSAAVALAGVGEELAALTGAPRDGFQQEVPSHLFVDESALAAETAAAYPNINHLVCRSSPVSIRALLEPLNALNFAPMLTPGNAPWWTEVNRTAQAQGASVMLTGACGNYALSSGGQGALLELFGSVSFEAFLSAVRRTGGNSIAGWRNVATICVGAFVPRSIYAALRNATRSSVPGFFDIPTLRQPWRRMAEEHKQRPADPRPARHFRSALRDELLNYEGSARLPSALWQIDVRDPTADRHLVEFCHSMPAEFLYSGAADRPAYEAAFADRIPRSVLSHRVRAYQQADWFELFDPQDLRAALRHYARNAVVGELVDVPALEAMLDKWPRGTDWMRNPKEMVAVSEAIQVKLLQTLSFASFIDLHFPDS